MKMPLNFKQFWFSFHSEIVICSFVFYVTAQAQGTVTENTKFFLFPAIIALENSITTGNSKS